MAKPQPILSPTSHHLQNITNLFSEALHVHAASAQFSTSSPNNNDLTFVSLITDHLHHAQSSITNLKIQKVNLAIDANHNLEQKYATYFSSVADLAWDMIEKARHPFACLSNDLKDKVQPLRACVAHEMRAPVHMYVYHYENRGAFERWDAGRQYPAMTTLDDSAVSKTLRALGDMVGELHRFCDVLRDVCMRALKVYGGRKVFAFGRSID